MIKKKKKILGNVIAEAATGTHNCYLLQENCYISQTKSAWQKVYTAVQIAANAHCYTCMCNMAGQPNIFYSKLWSNAKWS